MLEQFHAALVVPLVTRFVYLFLINKNYAILAPRRWVCISTFIALIVSCIVVSNL